MTGSGLIAMWRVICLLATSFVGFQGLGCTRVGQQDLKEQSMFAIEDPPIFAFMIESFARNTSCKEFLFRASTRGSSSARKPNMKRRTSLPCRQLSYSKRLSTKG